MRADQLDRQRMIAQHVQQCLQVILLKSLVIQRRVVFTQHLGQQIQTVRASQTAQFHAPHTRQARFPRTAGDEQAATTRRILSPVAEEFHNARAFIGGVSQGECGRDIG